MITLTDGRKCLETIFAMFTVSSFEAAIYACQAKHFKHKIVGWLGKCPSMLQFSLIIRIRSLTNRPFSSFFLSSTPTELFVG